MIPQLTADGDMGFNAVNDRLHPALLQPGTLSKLVNGTLEFGDIRNRWGIHAMPWGHAFAKVSGPLNSAAFVWTTGPDVGQNMAGDYDKAISGFTIGEWYYFTIGNSFTLSSDHEDLGGLDFYPSGTEITQSGWFQAESETYYLWAYSSESGNNCTATIEAASVGSHVALATMNDPEGYEYMVALAAVPRTLSGEDGGQGRAWKIQAGSAVVEIDLNGHDIWGESRLVPVRGGLVMLRHGPARWYWRYNSGTPNIDLATNIITLNSVDGLYTGDAVTVNYFIDIVNGVKIHGSINPISGTEYWVYIVNRANKTIYLCANRANALAGTAIDLTSVGTNARFYIQKQDAYAAASLDGSYNGLNATPLILQTAVTATTKVQSWVNGFVAARTGLTAKNTELTTEWFCENHNFMPGLAVRFVTNTGTTFLTGTFYYVNPLDSDRFTLHASVDDALSASSPLVTAAGGPYSVELIPFNATEAPMPGGREGTEVNGRLVVASGLDNLAVSNPHDFVHFQPYIAGVTANLGESTRITAVVPVSEYSVIVAKSDSVFALTGLDNVSSSAWRLQTVTKEYGCIAPLTAIQVGADVWMLSRSGVMSVRQTELSKAQGVAVPVSQPLAKSFLDVDWRTGSISKACAAWFNNRYLVAVPLRDQTGAVKNNRIYVYNFLNQSWDGYWESDTLDVVQFARHTVNGQQRLCFISSEGAVQFFVEEELTDMGEPIAMEAITRGYLAGNPGPKHWQELETCFDSWYPELSVNLISEGINESTTVQSGLTLSRAAFFTFNAGTREPDSTAAHAQDYSLICGDTDAVCSDDQFTGQFQSVTKRWPLHNRDRVVQTRMTIARGSVRIKSIGLAAMPDRMLAAAQSN